MDGKWTTDPTAPEESDGASNVNNVLTPEHISKSHPSSSAPDLGIMSNVTPQSTTANLAGKVPKEPSRDQGSSSGSAGLPGTFPETPAQEPSSFSVDPIPATSGVGNPVNLRPGEKVPDPSTLTSNTISSTVRDDPSLAATAQDSQASTREPSSFSVDPIPATSGVGNPVSLRPGEKVPDPSTLTSNTISSTVRDDPSLAETAQGSQKSFGVSPLPASSGIGNPVQVRPGEKLPDPSTFTQNTIKSTVTTDKDSYENSSGAPQLPQVVTPQKERDASGSGGLFNLPPVSGTMIPESSLPIGSGTLFDQDPGVTIQSSGPNSSTAALAGQVPLEPRSVPKGADKSLGRDSNPTIQSVGTNSSTAALAGQVPLEPRAVPKGSGTSFGQDPDVTIQSVGANSTTAGLAGQVPLEPRGVPEVVQDSQHEAHASPEASANSEAVREKSAVEKELGSKVREEPPTSEGIGGQTAGGAANFLTSGTSTGGSTSLPSRGLPTSVQQSIDEINTGTAIAPTVPDVVQESIAESHLSPEAAGSTIKVDEKYQVERELLAEVKKENAAGEPAPSSTAGLTPYAPSATNAATAATPATTPAEKAGSHPRLDSRDISPMSHPVGPSQTQPTVTTGVGSSTTPQTSQPGRSTPQKQTQPTSSSSSSSKPAQTTTSASASTDKKSKRASGFFGKLKQKFSDKDKDKKPS